MDRQIDLVIFDLDGTLVASEAIADKVYAKVIREELGLQISEADVRERYRGHQVDYALRDLEGEYGKPLPESFIKVLADTYNRAVDSDLVASVGVEEAIKAILPMKVCVASNGEPGMIRRTVDIVGLAGYFGGNYFSARDVPRAKPAPDVFLHAAAVMGVEPSRTCVVEDSVIGVSGALAAGMRVVGYTGNHPEMATRLKPMGVTVIDDFAALPPLILG